MPTSIKGLIYITCMIQVFTIHAKVRLPGCIQDSMVLQRDTKLNIWGWADPGENIEINWIGKKYDTRADLHGNWKIQLPPQIAGGPYTLQVLGNNEILLRDVLIGDVWMCAGQSNMVLTMERVKEKYAKIIAEADYPQIRFLTLPVLAHLNQPQEDILPTRWKSAVPRDILQISATAFFFAKTIYDKNKVPIGLINASVGGTPIESWISENALKSFPDLMHRIRDNKDTSRVNKINRLAVARRQAYQKGLPPDQGMTEQIRWYTNDYSPRGWHSINIPGYWEDQGIADLNGVVWYRKIINVPDSMIGIPAKIFMGRIVDADHLYINGTLIGNITYQYPPRRYVLPAGTLKAGNNVITIRVVNQYGKGGFVPDKPYYLIAGNHIIDLKGEWQYKVGAVYEPDSLIKPGGEIVAQNQPAALFNAMVAPITPYTIRGFLWYQGESNTGEPRSYSKLLPALIQDWRGQWKQGDLPFIYAQLPNFKEANYLPSESNWALLREAQLKALKVPNTAMTVNIDLGEWNDIHPLNKKDLGYRLALAAMHLTGMTKDQVYSGPVFKGSVIEGNKIILRFDHAGGGLTTSDHETPSYFSIAGADKKFVWAKAEIRGQEVIVWNDKINSPKYVRYAWADNPHSANLCNREGLPASPFRTDNELK